MRRLLPYAVLLLALAGTFQCIRWLDAGKATVQKQEGWFWPIRPGESGLVVLVVAVFLAALTARVVAEHGRREGYLGKLVLVVGVGWMLQQGFAFVDKNGMNTMRDRMLRTGHAEFAVTAARRLPVLPLVREYEARVKAPDQVYARSKPPGQLLFYMASAEVANVVMPRIWDPPVPNRPDVVDRYHWRLANFAALFFPLFSMLPAIPLAFLGWHFLGRARSLWPSFAFVLVPQAQLVTMHLDQVLYPLLLTSIWALAAKAAISTPRRAIGWWIAAGTLVWFSVYITFSILPGLVPLAFVAASFDAKTFSERLRQVVSGAAIAATTVGAWAAFFFVTLDYRLLTAYRRGFDNHVRWNNWRPSMQWPAARLDLSELAYWIGVPFTLLFLLQCFSWLGGLRRLREPVTVFALTTLVAIVVTAIVGKTIGEIARLWLFFTPAMVLAAMHALSRLSPTHPVRKLELLAAGQLAWIMALKALEDFR